MSTLTAREVIERIKQNIGVALPEDTVDTFKCGDPEAVVTGIAVTMMPALGVLQNAVAQGCNFIIAHEPLFYGHHDETKELENENDAVWSIKRDFIQHHKLVLWRFHDLPHLTERDMILSGMVEELGWQAFQSTEDERFFRLPQTTLDVLALQLQQKLKINCLRMVGDADLSVSKTAFSVGCPGFKSQRHLLQSDVDVLIMGEAREWETIAYAVDAHAAGLAKALIILGHIPSEQGGMKACARRLETLVPEVTVVFLPSQEPFRSPTAQP